MNVTNLFFDTGIAWGLTIMICYVLFQNDRDSRNPMDWSEVDRCLLLIAIYFFIVGAFCLMMGIMKSMPYDRFPYFKWELTQPFYHFFRFFGLSNVLLLFTGLWLRKRTSESSLFANTVIQLNAVFMAFTCYVWGPLTHPGPLLMAMALGSFYLLLFGLSFSLPWIITFTFLFVISTIATWFDLIPYSPVSGPPFIDGKIHGFYLVSHLTFVTTIFLLMLFIIASIIVRWRDRESKLAEMTALLRNLFGRYLSEEVMDTLIERPDSVKLGGQKRKVTMMMTDLRGFTSLSERLDPEQVMALLNRYFDVMMRICKKHHGTINDIFGDALLVTFGAPKEIKDHARAAVACAIEMQNAMQIVNKENMHMGLPKLEMGIGLNTDEVVVGNIGTEERAKFGVVGSGVNMTSRIESYTVGGQILVSESVRQEAGEVLRINGQREVLPKGAETPITIYEVGGISGLYNQVLEDKDPALVMLVRKIPLLYTILGGKHVGKERFKGFVVRLSKKSAEIELEESLELLTNLKMNLGDVDDELSAKDFYGKVIKRSGKKGSTQLIRFTSVPPEVDAYFQAHQQYAVS